ncbi:MAG: NAD(P)H-binding protein [Cephaloticoccus sp.]|nr:NAD(P)H-binding protein [Cephaloticoccus sp.]MCF7761031.1 NAD(P)H-binding protein [Cephaloticoccus sp.]
MEKLSFHQAAVLGATGPTGRHLTMELQRCGIKVRALSRSEVQLRAVDAAHGVAPLHQALDGCDLVFNCLGLPPALMHLHPVVAGNLAEAVAKGRARCVLVSSFWSYLPLVAASLDASHPRVGGPPWTRLRREAEDILRTAGAAIVHLPDFYGPEVHVSLLQQPLREATAGKAMNWVGSVDTVHEYAYVPDAMALVARLAKEQAAYGRNWIFPGSGPITGREVAGIASRELKRSVTLRGAGQGVLRLVSFFKPELRSFMPMVPDYLKPLTFDPSRLIELIGPVKATPYHAGIRQTLASLATKA